MSKPIKKSIDVFDDKYNLCTKIKSEQMCPESQQGMYETFGLDLLNVGLVYKETPKRVWSCIDAEETDGIVFVSGMLHRPIYYLITVEEAESENEYYILDMEEYRA